MRERESSTSLTLEFNAYQIEIESNAVRDVTYDWFPTFRFGTHKIREFRSVDETSSKKILGL